MSFRKEWKKFLSRLKVLLASAPESACPQTDTSAGPDAPGQPEPMPSPQPDSPVGPQPTDGEVRSAPHTFDFDALGSGEVSIETCGITHQDGRNDDGGWEYIFLTLHGNGFDRVILFHAGGGGRKVRFKVGTSAMQMGVASDDLPGWHTWSVKWGDGKMRFYLDGDQIGRDEPFNGTVSQVIAGGYDDSRRNFKGQWRNFSNYS